MLALLLLALSMSRGVAQTPPDVWRDEPAGQSRHVQSGLACPGQMLSDLPFVEAPDAAMVLQSVVIGDGAAEPGDRVGCEYEGKQGNWATVEIAKLGSDLSVSDVYADARKRLTDKFPSARRQDSAVLNCEPKRPADGTETHCAKYNHISVNGQDAVAIVVVGDTGGWAISLIQLKIGTDDASLDFMGPTNWLRIARSRHRLALLRSE